MNVRVLETPDGRELAVEEVGDLKGMPVFVLHGTPGSRLSGRHPDLARVRAAGLRVITYDRPGYGRSSRHRGRSVVDCVSDVALIADALEIESFAVTGGSGGGPHALAVGARLPERVTRVGCEVSPAPYDAPELDWPAGMDPTNVRELEWALTGEDTLARELRREAQRILDQLDDDDPTALFSEVDLSGSDRAVLADARVRQQMSASTREALAPGVWGWVDDDLALVKPWGFGLAELQVPVEIRYGATDVLVPSSHGEWLAAHTPHAVVSIDDRAGHLTTPDQRLERLRALAYA